MSSPMAHALLSPSSSHRWLTCTPSARLGERLTSRFGSESSPYAQEGTKAHALAEIKVRKAYYAADGMTTAVYSRMGEEERDAYTGINAFRYDALRTELGEIPSDMEHATDAYCDVVMEKYLSAKDRDPSTRLLLEQRLTLEAWVPRSFGSSDCVIVSDSLLEVIDYKNGLGIPVNAAGNPQLRLYGLGAIAKFGQLYDFPAVRMTIIQPRLESVSEETLDREALLAWAEAEVREKAQLAWKGIGDFVPGDHCRFCPAKAVCSARVAEALKLFRYGFETPGLIPDEQVPGILETLDTAEAWIKDFRAYAEKQALNGQKFPGWKLVRGKKPNRRWADPEEVRAQLLRAGYAPGQIETTSLKPVGEIEKAIGAKAFRALVGGLVAQGEGRLTLVPESDKRLEYASADAAFADLID